MAATSVKFLLSVSLLLGLLSITLGDVVLTKRVMTLALNAAKLSALAYEEDPPLDPTVYDHFGFFDSEPDQAIVASQDGYCYVAFRGTTLTWIDWQQNLAIGTKDICVEQSNETACCSSRGGFVEAFDTPYRPELERSLRSCASRCSQPEECVILTGHSQGGAVAAVAGLVFADLNPYVYTFGQPPTIELPCPMVTSERWFRFVNTRSSPNLGILYDPVPFVPGFGAIAFGQFIVLGDDPNAVAYIGLDSQIMLSPLDTLGFEAHSMVQQGPGKCPGYVDRLTSLMTLNFTSDTTIPITNETTHDDNSTVLVKPSEITSVTNNTNVTTTGTISKKHIQSIFPISTSGFIDGSYCSIDDECRSGTCRSELDSIFSLKQCVGVECSVDDDCETGRCDSGLCAPKLGSCQACDEDSDCASNRCLLFRCASDNQHLMDDNCVCEWNSDCVSQRCVWFTCEARLALESRCQWGSDCRSGYCSWRFRCENGDGAGDRSVPNGDEGKLPLGLAWIIVLLCVLTLVGSGTFYILRVQQQRGQYRSIPDVKSGHTNGVDA